MRSHATSSGKRPHVAIAGITALLLTAALLGQRALDSSLSASGDTFVPVKKTPGMSQSPYTLNRSTGTFTYNRANAFQDSSYQIYQRRTDRFTYFDPSTGRSSAKSVNAQRDVFQSSAGRPSGMAAPSYNAMSSPQRMGAAPVSGKRAGMAAPSYRVNNRVR